jgi:peptidoglycan/LPS O-acetylase OafA/YrhL
MTMRTRKLVGTILLLVLVIVYALLALAVAIVLQVNQAGKIAELAYYVLAGLLWVLPAGWLITWMSRPDDGRSPPAAQG